MSEQIVMILGALMVICGLGALANPAFFRRTMGSFTHTPSLVYVVGVANLAIGLYLVKNHNVWESLVQGIVAFFGWAALIRGAIMILAPDFFLRLFKKIWMGSHLKGEAFFLLIVGVIMLYLSW
jgi:hypothetical protein